MPVLRKICPGLVELYQRLEQISALPTHESEGAASQYVTHLARTTEGFSEPISLAAKQGLLQILLSHVAPELTERMVVRFHESAKKSQQKVDYLWMLTQQYQKLHAEQAQELDRRATQITDQQLELDRRMAQIRALSAELKSIYRTPVGKVIRSYGKLKKRWNKAA